MIKTGNISLTIWAVAVCGLLFSAGCSDAGKRGFTDREMDSFVAAMISVECRVHAGNAAKVETATGFSEDKLRAITDYLKEKQLVVEIKDIDGIRLINEGCP